MSEDQVRPRWIIAQVEPGPIEHTWWSLVDTQEEFVRGRLYGHDFAQAICAALNEDERRHLRGVSG